MGDISLSIHESQCKLLLQRFSNLEDADWDKLKDSEVRSRRKQQKHAGSDSTQT